MLDAHQVNVFVTAAQVMNFSEAARRLHMTQPSVSQHIQALEKQFETKLFDRKGRHLALTEAGETLVPLASQFVKLSMHISETMASLQGEVHGHLQFGCSTTAGKYILPRLLAGFRDRHPRVQITCHVRDSSTALHMLSAGKVHLALASEPVMLKDIEFRKFMDDPLVLVVHPDHPWAMLGTIKPVQLIESEFILREPGSGARKVLVRGLPEIGLSIDQLHTVMTLGNAEAISMAVQEGIAAAFLSRLVVAAPLRREELVEVKVKGLSLSQEIWIGRNIDTAVTQAQTAFWGFVHTEESKMEVMNQTEALNSSNLASLGVVSYER